MNFNEFEKYKSLVDSELDNLYSNGPKLLLEPILTKISVSTFRFKAPIKSIQHNKLRTTATMARSFGFLHSEPAESSQNPDRDKREQSQR